jgi:hypothetical protein
LPGSRLAFFLVFAVASPLPCADASFAAGSLAGTGLVAAAGGLWARSVALTGDATATTIAAVIIRQDAITIFLTIPPELNLVSPSINASATVLMIDDGVLLGYLGKLPGPRPARSSGPTLAAVHSTSAEGSGSLRELHPT